MEQQENIFKYSVPFTMVANELIIRALLPRHPEEIACHCHRLATQQRIIQALHRGIKVI